ncbi:hypothetical protein FSARC_6353 [Fusarium sarcochroum]|uniref:Uncharacterized protein n=1 Tax=Fusarium sarcochroum TaxID=1208366 RepID=A0A8H4X8G5_9HYPO|nr:hypothetical protein FSARC_6353 [Fusarium sarcochroum]
MTTQEIRNDSHISTTRAAAITIMQASDLTKEEKGALHDLLQVWMEMRPGGRANDHGISSRLRKDFYDIVFHLWDSSTEFNPLPTLSDQKLPEIAVSVGTFREDLPLTPRKSKRGQQDQEMKSRRSGALAWLSAYLTADEGGVRRCLHRSDDLWRDSTGPAVNSKYVQLNEGLTMEKAIERAVINFDQNDRDMVENYNTRLVVALARSRIYRFGQAGTHSAPVVPHHLQVNERTIKCDSIGDTLEAMAQSLTTISDRIKRRQTGAAQTGCRPPGLWGYSRPPPRERTHEEAGPGL